MFSSQLEEFNSEDLENHEEYKESNEDTKVSPDVRFGVRVSGRHVGVSVDCVLSNTSTLDGTELVWSDTVIRESGDTSSRDVSGNSVGLITSQLKSTEFVGENSFVSIRQRVEVE